jgi:hypothetical protein
LQDVARRAEVVAHARSLWSEGFQWADLRPRVAALATRVIAQASRPPAPAAE